MKKQKQTWIMLLLLFFMAGAGGCDKKEQPLPPEEPLVEEPEEPTSDEGGCGNLQGKDFIEVIEIKDFPTKLYYRIPPPIPIVVSIIGGMKVTRTQMRLSMIRPWILPGLKLSTLTLFPTYSLIRIHCLLSSYLRICNFPDSAVAWNTHVNFDSRGTSIYEGVLDVLINGIFRVTYNGVYNSSLYFIAGDLELTSIEKLIPLNN